MTSRDELNNRNDDNEDVVDNDHRTTMMMMPPPPPTTTRPNHRYSEPIVARSSRELSGHHDEPRRWRSVMKCRSADSTSLTEEEERLLMSLGPNNQTPSHQAVLVVVVDTAVEDAQQPLMTETPGEHGDNNTSEAVVLETARDKLLSTVRARRQTMTHKEISFLQELAQNPELLLEQLEQVTDVLEHDPLFELSKCLADMEDDDDDDEDEVGSSDDVVTDLPTQSELERRKSLLPDACFRREVWLRCEAEDVNNKSWMENCHNLDGESSMVVNVSGSTRNLFNVSSEDLAASLEEEEKEEDTRASTLRTDNSNPFHQKKSGFRWGSFVYKIQQSMRLIPNEDDTNADTISSSKLEDEEKSQEEEEEEEVSSTFTVLARSVRDLTEIPTVLTPPIMDALRPHLPYILEHDNYWLKYSLLRGDGGSMRTLLHKIRSSCRTVVAIETTRGEVFGSFTSSPWRAHGPGFYGSGEAFLWRLSQSRYIRCATVEEQIALEGQVTVYPWSGKNRSVQCSTTSDSDLIVGGGGPDEIYDTVPLQHHDNSKNDKEYGFGLVIHHDLERGYTQSCVTFQSPPLVVLDHDDNKGDNNSGDFEIANLEVWTFTPVDSLEQAEKLELSRQFIFDHGNFAMS